MKTILRNECIRYFSKHPLASLTVTEINLCILFEYDLERGTAEFRWGWRKYIRAYDHSHSKLVTAYDHPRLESLIFHRHADVGARRNPSTPNSPSTVRVARFGYLVSKFAQMLQNCTPLC
ncbi:hypothetical protein CDAR_207051 [Caerostris darwini]|uniref:Uncharacterized protein n=1 Tax=Caerostris darwini TaxID=1538125 RepID=A0AAV4SN25_9ARAC|nr:hypothetical protein CDAR_207051 [Caerostris darwini]